MKKKKIASLVLCFVMIATMGITASATDRNVSDITSDKNNYTNPINNEISISNQKEKAVFEKIKGNILYKYGDLYSLDDFSYEFGNEREDGEDTLIDVNVSTTMTLTQHPSDSAFVKELTNELGDIEDPVEKGLVQDEINSYIDEIETLYYNKPHRSMFAYTIKLNQTQMLKAAAADSDYQLFYRMDISDDEVILEQVKEIKKVGEDTKAIRNNVKAALNDLRVDTSTLTAKATVSYDRIEARDYALDHATDTPEFSKANKQGSDCANFVSKSINAGGIPVDKSGKWYPSSDGTINTCGDNWMRTGYYQNGGVVPYMTDKGYFYEQSNTSKVFAGSIMYWNKTSHVALVTYGDGSKIEYTQHSNKKLSSSAATVVYETENATFYMPSSSIL